MTKVNKEAKDMAETITEGHQVTRISSDTIDTKTLILCEDEFCHTWTQTWGDIEKLLARTKAGREQMVYLCICLGMEGEATMKDRLHKKVKMKVVTRQ